MLVDDEDYGTLSAHTWYALMGRNTTYAIAYNNGKTIYMHRMIMGLVDAPRGIYVDHINGNGLHNNRANLRISDNQNNQRNQRKHAKAHSRHKGVSRDKRNLTKPWIAQITLSGKKKHLGCYRTEIEAARAYNNAALEHFGEHAHLNIIGPPS